MRLIDADALQNILLPITTALEHEYGSLGGAVSGCMKHIDNAPTMNAVPVVRCKDCVYWDDDPDTYGADDGPKGKCMKSFETMCADDFCSYGERKDEVNES